MSIIPVLSIALEFVIALIALVLTFRGRPYMAGFAITFGIYVYYDLAREYQWQVSEPLLSVVFLIATLAALAAIIGISRDTRSK